MNLARCFVSVAVSLKRWSMVFVLAMAAIYCVMPAVARADFTLQYTGPAFNLNDPNCGITSDPYVNCLAGHLAMSFDVQGDLPTARPSTFCLALTVIGQPKTGCLTVTSGTINAGGIDIPLVGSSQNNATFTLSPGLNFWTVDLYPLSANTPSTSVITFKDSDEGVSSAFIHSSDGSLHEGNSNAAGSWTIPNGVGVGAGQGTPFGADAQLFGILANGALRLASDTEISTVSQSGTTPKVGAETATVGGPVSYLTGDLVTSDPSGRAISLGGYDKVAGQCVTAGGSVATAGRDNCGSIDTTGSNALLNTLGNAQAEAKAYAGYLAALAPTRTLGDIKLQKFQQLTIKLGPGLNVVSISNITTGGVNIINILAPSGAVVVFNIGGTIQLGRQTFVIAEANGLSPQNLIWNVQGANPIIGERVAFEGTLLNFPAADTTVTVGAGSLINGAVLSNGNVMGNGALHLNFWPFSGALPTTP
jgi:hypothetical protein